MKRPHSEALAKLGPEYPRGELGPWQIAWRKLWRNSSAAIGLAGICAILLIVTLAEWVAPFPPTELNYQRILEEPSAAHLFGTDDLGRDVLSRVIWGGRESLRAATLGILIALIGGLFFGLISGFYGGWLDNLIMRLVDVMLAFPTVLLLLSIVAVLGPSLLTVLIALGFSSIPAVTRLVRGSVLAVREMEYISAARALGAGDARLMAFHILPNILAPIIVFGTVGMGGAIMATAGLSYIGLGAQPPSPEWGAMLNYGRQYLRDAWWMSIFPGLAIFLSVLFVNMLGDGLREALDPKLR